MRKKDNPDSLIHRDTKTFPDDNEIIYSQKTRSRRNVKFLRQNKCNIDRNLNQQEEMKSTLHRINETKYNFLLILITLRNIGLFKTKTVAMGYLYTMSKQNIL